MVRHPCPCLRVPSATSLIEAPLVPNRLTFLWRLGGDEYSEYEVTGTVGMLSKSVRQL